MCEACKKLMNAYDSAVTVYLKASRQLTGMIGDDFNRTYQECEKLRLVCRSANDALIAHVRREHAISLQRMG